ncbi:ynaI [Symbiodinium pilosum]|uniref:YnaI protein n=1 Tax=Symbiodinium pilosum TaxID=2952 RepID=A0A812Y9D3_SYMPI|nr:ynaI [Symbiodinium pilosum]
MSQDGNLYSFELLRAYEPLVQAVRASAKRADRASGPRPGENALAFLDFLSYPADGAPSSTDIFRYLAPLEDMIDLSDGGGTRQARRMKIPRQKRPEHVFTPCWPQFPELCTETDVAVLENASEWSSGQIQAEVERLAEDLDPWKTSVAAFNAERLDRIAVLKRRLLHEVKTAEGAKSRLLQPQCHYQVGVGFAVHCSATPRPLVLRAAKKCGVAMMVSVSCLPHCCRMKVPCGQLP